MILKIVLVKLYSCMVAAFTFWKIILWLIDLSILKIEFMYRQALFQPKEPV